MLELPGVPQPIEIEMHQREEPRLVHVHQRVGRTAHGRRDAAFARESPGQGGLARAEVACQIKDGRLLETGRPCRGKPRAERLSLLG